MGEDSWSQQRTTTPQTYNSSLWPPQKQCFNPAWKPRPLLLYLCLILLLLGHLDHLLGARGSWKSTPFRSWMPPVFKKGDLETTWIPLINPTLKHPENTPFCGLEKFQVSGDFSHFSFQAPTPIFSGHFCFGVLLFRHQGPKKKKSAKSGNVTYFNGCVKFCLVKKNMPTCMVKLEFMHLFVDSVSWQPSNNNPPAGFLDVLKRSFLVFDVQGTGRISSDSSTSESMGASLGSLVDGQPSLHIGWFSDPGHDHLPFGIGFSHRPFDLK